MAARKASFGSIRKLPSGRYQARYTVPNTDRQVAAPSTFGSKVDAQTWLAMVRTDLARGEWTPATRDVALRAYAVEWLAHRDLKPRTRSEYRKMLDRLILPELGDLGMRRVSPSDVRRWFNGLDPSTPTLRARSYSLLATIFKTAVAEEVVSASPCRIRGAGQAKRATTTDPLDADQLARLVAAMPERLRLAVLLATWCAVRFGELFELRAADVDLRRGVLKVRRGVVRVDGEVLVGTPKSDAGVRDVAVPPHVLDDLRAHVRNLDRGALLFPSVTDPDRHMAPSTLYGSFYAARDSIGRPDLRWHDLRHTGAVLAAATGATIAELMARLGHSTSGAAMRYQHAARDRDSQIAAAMSDAWSTAVRP